MYNGDSSKGDSSKIVNLNRESESESRSEKIMSAESAKDIEKYFTQAPAEGLIDEPAEQPEVAAEKTAEMPKPVERMAEVFDLNEVKKQKLQMQIEEVKKIRRAREAAVNAERTALAETTRRLTETKNSEAADVWRYAKKLADQKILEAEGQLDAADIQLENLNVEFDKLEEAA